MSDSVFKSCKRGDLCGGGYDLHSDPQVPYCPDCHLEDCPAAKSERIQIEMATLDMTERLF